MKIKSHKKRILFFGIIITLVILVTVKYLSKGSQENFPAKTDTEKQVTPTLFAIPEGDDLKISGVEVDNFYRTSEILNVKGDVAIVKNINYEIFYFPETSQFLISITSSPFEEARQSGEEEFIKIIGSKEKACSLNVVITTPRYVNPDEAGESFNLSFCE